MQLYRSAFVLSEKFIRISTENMYIKTMNKSKTVSDHERPCCSL